MNMSLDFFFSFVSIEMKRRYTSVEAVSTSHWFSMLVFFFDVTYVIIEPEFLSGAL